MNLVEPVPKRSACLLTSLVVGEATFSDTTLTNFRMRLLWLVGALSPLIAKDSYTALKAMGSCEKVDPARRVRATPEESGASVALLGVSYAEQIQSAKRCFENVFGNMTSVFATISSIYSLEWLLLGVVRQVCRG